MSVDLTIIKRDSAFYANGQRIDSLVLVLAKYKCIGKNGYGVEDEVESSSLIYLDGRDIKDLSGKLKKTPLELASSGRSVDRSFSLYDDDGSIIIQPSKISGEIHLIVTTNESCVEGSRLTIYFQNNENFSCKSWNDFNCKSTSYFKLTPAQIELLRNNPVMLVSFSEDETLVCSVPGNERDYFIQAISLFRGTPLKQNDGYRFSSYN